MELDKEIVLGFPSRWVTRGELKHDTAVSELDALCNIVVKGCEAITGVYMRLCDLIRGGPLSDSEVRQQLAKHFQPSRVSEILRVARAPEAVYMRYHLGCFGFRTALRECRGYQVYSTVELNRRKAKRAAERLAQLVEPPATIRIRGRVITIGLDGC